jgi:hypothetical protein
VSGGESAQPGPPPPPPSGTPFGRFKTVVVGIMVATVASVAALQYAGDGGGGSSSGPEPGLAGSWSGGRVPTASGGEPSIRLELEDDGTGTFTRGRCSGTLAPFRAGQKMATFVYTETSGQRRCPPRSRVTVTLVDEDTLRFVQRRGDRTLASGTLRRS